jgi:hypothetical protein
MNGTIIPYHYKCWGRLFSSDTAAFIVNNTFVLGWLAYVTNIIIVCQIGFYYCGFLNGLCFNLGYQHRFDLFSHSFTETCCGRERLYWPRFSLSLNFGCPGCGQHCTKIISMGHAATFLHPRSVVWLIGSARWTLLKQSAALLYLCSIGGESWNVHGEIPEQEKRTGLTHRGSVKSVWPYILYTLQNHYNFTVSL